MAIRTMDEQQQRRQQRARRAGRDIIYGVMQGRRQWGISETGQRFIKTPTAAGAVRLAAALPAETFPTPLATRSGPGYHAEEWDLRRLEHRAHLARYLWSLRLVRSAARQEPTIVTASDAAVAARIREVRRARVLTQEELAERLGVPQSAVARWESGRVAGIRPRTIRKLAGALGVEPEALTGGVPAALAQRYANA